MMKEEAENLNFERAAELRDLLYTVKRVGMQREANVDGSADLIAFALKEDQASGLKYSSGATIEPSEIMESFFRDYVRLYHEQGVLAYVNGAVAETLKFQITGRLC